MNKIEMIKWLLDRMSSEYGIHLRLSTVKKTVELVWGFEGPYDLESEKVRLAIDILRIANSAAELVRDELTGGE